jgi:hypothetical protein
MDVDPEQLDLYLRRYEPGEVPETEMDNVATKLQSFVSHLSSFEGAEVE